ncbi:MAG: universal stress protein [Trueperaceae bacterium]|nr:universal stress protein [Trueperaceae bacterium]
MTSEPQDPAGAAVDFVRARRRANLHEVLDALSGREASLLSYDDVRRRLHAVESPQQILEDVPLDAIVGSVGRTHDFTRGFLPKTDADKSRWMGVRMAMTGMMGTPPVDLYRIGDAYFVRDGNHRVSVARQLGAKSIQAYVTPVFARVPFSADASPDDVIIAEEHAAFLERTELDEVRPGADVRVTTPGAFERLLEHIDVHRYFMGLDEDREVGYQEAVEHWYDAVYLPVIERIRARGLLRGFEGRTETDLYLWLSEHRGKLIDELGIVLPSEAVAEAVGRSVDDGDADAPEARHAVLEAVARGRRDDAADVTLTDDVLVHVGAEPSAWSAVAQALVLAASERSRVYGVHVAADAAAAEAPAVAALRARFEAACAEAGVVGQFSVAVGNPVPALLARAAWVDLLVAPVLVAGTEGAVAGRASPAATARLAPGMQTLLRRSPVSVLAVPGAASPLTKGLVAFDGGSRSQAALFAGAYLATKRDLPLVVLTVADLARTGAATLAEARAYLERHGVAADYVEKRGPVAEAIVTTAAERGCDLILMGSHRYARWLETMLGGVLERVLRSSPVPVLVT